MNNIDVSFEYEDYPIQGKMIVARIHLPAGASAASMSESERKEIRKALVEQMAHFMLDNNLAEFMRDRTIDPNSFEPVDRIAARCFIVPDSNVKIVRALKR